MLAHATAKRAGRHGSLRPLAVVAGDLNQPNERDYPPHEWEVIAQDLARAKLAASDGVMQLMREGGWMTSFEAASTPRALPATTAWNGAVVDYCFLDGSATTAVDASSYVYYTLASDHLPLVTDLTPG